MKTMILAFAAVAALTTVSANAAPAVPTTTVSYADLDIHSPAGMKTLSTRIRNAANGVCSTATSGDLASRGAAVSCRNAAVAGAMKQLPDFGAQQVASR